MRYIRKKQLAEDWPFLKWKKQHSEIIKKWCETHKAETIWSELGKTFGQEREDALSEIQVRNHLLDSLYDEQHGLCCYCGDKIERTFTHENQRWEYKNCSIEHFYAKNKHKNLIFEYSNLMLCCKESKRLKQYKIGQVVNGKAIKSIEDIAEKVNISVELIKDYNLKFKEKDTYTIPLPSHCDDSKSEYDGKTIETIIINPTINKDLIDNLLFTSEGKIENKSTDTQIFEKTFKVLNLNCTTLIDRRLTRWNAAMINFQTILETELVPVEMLVNKLITGLSTPNESGMLSAFYFVEISFLRSLLNGKYE